MRTAAGSLLVCRANGMRPMTPMSHFHEEFSCNLCRHLRWLLKLAGHSDGV